MKLILRIKPNKDAPSNWVLQVLNKLNEFLETLQIDDFNIELAGIDPCIVSMIEPEASAEKGAPEAVE